MPDASLPSFDAPSSGPNPPLTPVRAHDVSALLEIIARGLSVSVVGLSNLGKSTLLRQMVQPSVAAAYAARTGRPALFVYVDCNRMLELSTQGLYEVILRAVLEVMAGENSELRDQVQSYYDQVVAAPGNSFTLPLAFNNALLTVLDPPDERDLVLLLDEFDPVFTGLDGRVFLNFRGFKDKYGDRLNYVTATMQPLTVLSGGDQLGEFVEVFTPHKYHLKPLSEADATELAAEIFQAAGDHLDPPERDFILAQAGGHPGLIQAVAEMVLQVESGAPAQFTQQAFTMAGDALPNHRRVRAELRKLWQQLLESERETVTLAASRGASALSDMQRVELLTRGLLVHDSSPAARPEENSLRLFAQLFADYARRQALVQQPLPDGIWVDSDAGTVWINGARVEALTDLEYRLLLLLYGRLDKICDKYQIVESVWGQDYLGEVDDARIEKLVSRLRAKLEPDPSHPRYIVTVRGRGYRLTGAGRAVDGRAVDDRSASGAATE